MPQRNDFDLLPELLSRFERNEANANNLRKSIAGLIASQLL